MEAAHGGEVMVAPTAGDPTFAERSVRRARIVAPGLALALIIALVATALSTLTPSTIGPVLIAVLLGLAVGNVVPLPAVLGPGLTVATKRVLRLGVVLLGARLSLGDVLSLGAVALWFAIACMTAALLSVAVLARLLRVPTRLAVLLGVGTAVCGNSAIMATAPVIEADEREIGFAVGTITLFGTSALLLFPLIGRLLSLPDEVFGFWVGLAINDTSQVVAAGAVHSPRALEVATVVKLVRNALMAPLIVLIAWWSMRSRVRAAQMEGREVRSAALKAFPLFVVGFLVVATLSSFGVISADLSSRMGEVSGLLIVIAIAAVGLTTNLGEIRAVGIRPVLVALGASSVLAVLGLALSQLIV
jgi:uncharacterized integral membrane protein (TIGR00698 family)